MTIDLTDKLRLACKTIEIASWPIPTELRDWWEDQRRLDLERLNDSRTAVNTFAQKLKDVVNECEGIDIQSLSKAELNQYYFLLNLTRKNLSEAQDTYQKIMESME